MIALTATVLDLPEHFQAACKLGGVAGYRYHNVPNIGVVEAYHKLWKSWQHEDALLYLHDDVTIHDANWVERVALELMAPEVAIVGFGGATGIGTANLYKTPFRIEQLIRSDYASNQTDWATHGTREIRERRVAVVDGFFMGIKGKFLRELGGWDWVQSNFHCYDIAMCLEAYRRGWEVRTVGVHCEHHGGGTSTKSEYIEFCRDRGRTPADDHIAPHRWLYEEYRDSLPLRVTP